MTFFGLDTAGRTVSAALLQDGQLVCESFLNTGLTHSETLMGLVDGAFRSAGLGPADVDVWGVCSGPGSFTGLRIGLAAVKGMAFPTGALCAPVSTLEALAQGCPGGEGTVLTALDARRGQVYWAAFDLAPGHARLAPDAAAPVTSLAAFIKNCKKPLFFVGDGAKLCYNEYGQIPGVHAPPPALGHVRGLGVCLAAARMHAAGQCVLPAALVPSYHRLSQAERERAEREKSKGGPL